ncbi:S26 family signal peptidase [Streptomyces sp. NPDC050617]|uniref:S26 family signal peptidase n=1 Tax=Streptomyces sp. NPDC050617 TaxID=3154628 RepID=UPI00343A67BE
MRSMPWRPRPFVRRPAPIAPFVLVAAPLLGVLLARRRFAVITVAGASMEPAYTGGDRVLVRRLGRSRSRGRSWGRSWGLGVGGGIGRGDVVVAMWRPPSGDPPGELAKAIAPALTPPPTPPEPRQPGDEPSNTRIRLIKRVAAGPGDLVPAGLGPALAADAGRPVPPDQFVLLGDNTAHSHDSRHIGYLERGDILGVVIRGLERHR